MAGLPWENTKIYIHLEQLLTGLLISGEKWCNLFQMCFGDVDDDMPPCSQVNLDSQSFEGFLLQNLGQFHISPTFLGRFIGTKDISGIQDLFLLVDDFDEFNDSDGSLFDSSSIGLL